MYKKTFVILATSVLVIFFGFLIVKAAPTITGGVINGVLTFSGGTTDITTISNENFSIMPGTGKVGIGTTAPAYTLDVNGTINGTSVLVNGVAVGSGSSQWTSGTGGIIYYNSGSVGIGTTNPLSTLDVKGALRLTAATAGYASFALPATASSTAYTWPANPGTSGYVLTTNGSGTLSWTAASGGSQTPWTSNINAAGYTLNGNSTASGNLTLDSTSNATKGYILLNPTSGNVGIGTVTPTAKLYVNGSLLTNSTVNFSALGGGGNMAVMSDNNGLLYTATPVSLPTGTSGQTLRHNGTSWVANSVIYNNGTNVGIGTASPAAKLTVYTGNGTSGFKTDLICSTATSSKLLTDASGNIICGSDQTGSGTGNIVDSLGATLEAGNNAEGNNIVNTGFIGIGILDPGSELSVNGTLRLYGSSSGYVGLRGAAAAGATTYTLPSTDGASSTVLTTNGAGTLSWTAAGGGSQTPWLSNINAAGYTLYGNSSVGGDLNLDSTSSGTKGDVLLNSGGGNVGVGTGSPSNKLQIGPNPSSYSGWDFVVSNYNGGIAMVNNSGWSRIDSSQRLDLYSNSVSTMILSSGNVGIGTLPTPGTKLDVQGIIRANGMSGSSVGGIIGDNGGGSQMFSLTRQDSGEGASLSVSAYGGLGLTAGRTTGPATGSYHLYVRTNGYVGVGTTAPAAGLDVQRAASNYTILAGNYKIGNVALPTLAADAATKGYVDGVISGGYWSANGINIYSSNSGYVGIGVTNPTFKLDVGGTINMDTLAINGSEVSATATELNYVDGVTSNIQTQLNSKMTTPAGSTSQTLRYDGSNWSASSILSNNGTNVGINTTAPGSTLDVKGTIRLSGATSGYVGLAPAAAAGSVTYTLPTTAGSNGQVLTSNGSGSLSWTTVATGGSQTPWTSDINAAGYTLDGNNTAGGSLTLDSTSNSTKGYIYLNPTGGNVGVGTYNPGRKLSVQADGSGEVFQLGLYNSTAKTWSSSVRDGIYFEGRYTGQGSNTAVGNINYGFSGSYLGGGATLAFGLLNSSGTVENMMTLKGSGNVGIGTSAPNELLSLGTVGAKLGVLSLAGSSMGKVTIRPGSVSGTWTLTLPTVAGTNGYFLQTDGNGVTSWAAIPAGLTGSGTANYIPKWTGSSALGNSTIYDNGTTVGINTTSPSASYELDINGEAISTAWRTNSDIRYKTNISVLTDVLSKLEKINAVSYDWDRERWPEKNFSATRQIGFIAQNVEKEFPEVVMTDAEGYKGLQYDRFSAILLEAIKEQQLEINNLEARIIFLEKALGTR